MENIQFERNCPICGGTVGKTLFHFSVNMSDIKHFPAKYNVVACENCGMAFADAALTKELLESYYENQNNYENVDHVKAGLYDESCAIYYKTIHSFCSKEESILDIGCGNGHVLSFLKGKGYSSLCGLEPAKAAIKKLAEHGFEGIEGSIYRLSYHDIQKTFDTALCIGVLEHFLDLDISLEHISSLLKDDGKIYVALPAAEGFGEYIRELPNYFNVEHINYFTLSSLDNLLRKYGFIRITKKEESFALVNPSAPEVIISAMYQKTHGKKDIIYDSSGEISIKKWLKEKNAGEKAIQKLVHNVLESKQKYAIWGTGNFCKYILSRFPTLLDHILFFIDSDEGKRGESFQGKKIYMPEELTGQKNVHILICSMLSADEIAKQAEERKLPFTVIRYEVLQKE